MPVKIIFSKICLQKAKVQGFLFRSLECELSCQEPIILRICNDTSAVSHIRNFARESILPLEAFLENSETLQFWPNSCHRLMQSKSPYFEPIEKLMQEDQNGRLDIDSDNVEEMPENGNSNEI